MPEDSPQYTGFGRFDLVTYTPEVLGRLDHTSVVELSYDVHDMWRSTLEPGADTPFSPDIVSSPDFYGGETFDAANIDPERLPANLKAVSYMSALIVANTIDTHLISGYPIDDVRVEKMAINLYTFWGIIKNQSPFLPHQDVDFKDSEVSMRIGGMLEEPERVKVLDRRIVLAGIASLFDEARFPMWQGREDVSAARQQPHIQAYARKGKQILAAVEAGRPAPIGTSVDDLHDLSQ